MQIHGAKKQKGGSQKPNIQKDTTASTNFFQGLYGLSEGEIYGLVDGGKSIKLDGTPIINDNGQANFTNITWDFRAGTIDQEHIKGFSSVENESSVNVELRHDRPYTKALSNTQLSAVAVRLAWNALREQKDNGDIVGYRIEYAIDVQTDGGAWATVLNTAIHDKASQGYQRSHRIDLPKAKRGWVIRVRRITPNRDSDLISDGMSVSAITEIIDAKLRYPCTALLALKYDAETFSNIAKVAVRLRGLLIQVPTNYDPTTRKYNGLWDGTFKLAYSNNPAWVFYDICTAKRYGLGERLAGKVDKWALYQLGQYCDELVDDGKGGKEPRFTVNVYIQKAEDAYQVLQNLASVFRALSYWDGQNIIVDADTPKEPVYTFTNANVVDGAFSYTGTRARDRHTVVKCGYDDPDNNFETDYIFVRDEYAIAKYGFSQLDLNVFGCTSQGQAQRAGLWALQSEQLETETVTFKTGLDGFIPKVGEIVNVMDNHRAGRMQAGRIVGVNGKTVTLDRMAGKVGDEFIVQDKTAKIVKIDGVAVTLDKAIGTVGQVFAISSSDLAPRAYRVMTISQNDDATFSFTALQYEIGKFTATDTGVRITPKPVSVIKAHVLTPPNSVNLTANTRTVQGQAVTTLSINWEQVTGAVAYIVEWRKDDNAWQSQKIASQSLDIDGVYAGNYQARVRAVDAFDNESLTTSSPITAITGKQGKPPKLARLTATGQLFGMALAWVFNAGSDDTNYTEIQVSPDGRANITTLGTFAYPTNKHEITGLQGNLTQFYRARIVDKLGNTSDWTDWTSGTTSADATAVLELIQGQIDESHLHQTLLEPIKRIDEVVDKEVRASIQKIEQTIEQNNHATAQQIQTLQTEVNGKMASIQTIAQSVDGIKNEYAVKVDNNGRVAGFGLMGSASSSEFAVVADKFYIAPPSGTGKGKTPFTVLTTPQTINGVTVPAGTYIDSAYIQNGSITNAHIANASISSAKIQDGSITTAKIGTAQVDTLQIKGEAVVIPRAQSFQVVREFDANTTTTLFGLELNALGNAVLVSAFLYGEFDEGSGTPSLQVLLMRGDEVIFSDMFSELVQTPIYETRRKCEIISDSDRRSDRETCYNYSVMVGMKSKVKGNFIVGGLVDRPPSGNTEYRLIIVPKAPSGYTGKLKIHRASLSLLGVKR